MAISVLTWENDLAANFTFIPFNVKYRAMKRYYALTNEYIEMHSTPGKNSKSTGNIVLYKAIFNESYDIAYFFWSLRVSHKNILGIFILPC